MPRFVVANMACGQQITKIETGAVVAHKEEIRPIRSYAKIFVKLSQEHTFDETWSTILKQIQGEVSQTYNRGHSNYTNVSEIFYKRIASVKRRIQRLSARELQRRKRRGLFNFIGDVASSLFGIPSASDVSALKEANQKLAGAVQGVMKTTQAIVVKVNQLGQQQEQIRDKLGEVITEQARQFAQLKRLSTLAYSVYDSLRFSLLIEIVEDNIAIMEDAVNNIRNARVACESRIVNEHVVPMKMVSELLRESGNLMDILSNDYYGYMVVDKLTVIDGELYCLITGPMFDTHTHMEVTIKTLPMCSENRCAQLHQPPPFIIDYQTEDLYFPDECHGPTPKACRPGVIFDKVHQPCLHGLINHDPQQQIVL